MASKKVFYYIDSHTNQEYSITENEFKKNVVLPHDTTDKKFDDLIESYRAVFLDIDDIHVDPSKNATQATGNTEVQIKQYQGIWSSKIYNPNVQEPPPIVMPNNSSEINERYVNVAGYKRIGGAKESKNKNPNVQKIIPVLLYTAKPGKEEELRIFLNDAENVKRKDIGPKKVCRTAQGIATSVNKLIQNDNKNVNNMDDDEIMDYIKEFTPSKDNINSQKVKEQVFLLNGVPVPLALTKDEAKKAIDKWIRDNYPEDKNTSKFTYYPVSNKMKYEDDRIKYYLQLKRKGKEEKLTRLFLIQSNTNVTKKDEEQFNKDYLNFEKRGGTEDELKQMLGEFENKIPVHCGYINKIGENNYKIEVA